MLYAKCKQSVMHVLFIYINGHINAWGIHQMQCSAVAIDYSHGHAVVVNASFKANDYNTLTYALWYGKIMFNVGG